MGPARSAFFSWISGFGNISGDMIPNGLNADIWLIGISVLRFLMQK